MAARVGIRSDGNGGVILKRPTLATIIAVATALGWGGGDLLAGPHRVREDERLKMTVEQVRRDLERHQQESEARFREVEDRAEKALVRIDERLAKFETRLDEAIQLLVAKQSNGGR